MKGLWSTKLVISDRHWSIVAPSQEQMHACYVLHNFSVEPKEFLPFFSFCFSFIFPAFSIILFAIFSLVFHSFVRIVENSIASFCCFSFWIFLIFVYFSYFEINPSVSCRLLTFFLLKFSAQRQVIGTQPTSRPRKHIIFEKFLQKLTFEKEKQNVQECSLLIRLFSVN